MTTDLKLVVIKEQASSLSGNGGVKKAPMWMVTFVMQFENSSQEEDRRTEVCSVPTVSSHCQEETPHLLFYYINWHHSITGSVPACLYQASAFCCLDHFQVQNLKNWQNLHNQIQTGVTPDLQPNCCPPLHFHGGTVESVAWVRCWPPTGVFISCVC